MLLSYLFAMLSVQDIALYNVLSCSSCLLYILYLYTYTTTKTFAEQSSTRRAIARLLAGPPGALLPPPRVVDPVSYCPPLVRSRLQSRLQSRSPPSHASARAASAPSPSRHRPLVPRPLVPWRPRGRCSSAEVRACPSLSRSRKWFWRRFDAPRTVLLNSLGGGMFLLTFFLFSVGTMATKIGSS